MSTDSPDWSTSVLVLGQTPAVPTYAGLQSVILNAYVSAGAFSVIIPPVVGKFLYLYKLSFSLNLTGGAADGTSTWFLLGSDNSNQFWGGTTLNGAPGYMDFDGLAPFAIGVGLQIWNAATADICLDGTLTYIQA